MRYPESIKLGDYIGITAPSMGVTGERNIKRADSAIKNLESKGYKIKETPNVRTMENVVSSPAKQRKEEFISLLKDEQVKAIIFAEGGEFLCEMLDELDLDEIEKLPIKWMQGYSDITNINYLWTTKFDIATIYGPNYKSFGMNPWHTSQENSIKLMQNQELVQESYELYEKFEGWDAPSPEDPCSPYKLTEKVEWKNLNNETEIKIKGRCIGGCIDTINDLAGTKFDYTKQFIEKYKKDGIVWFFDPCEFSTPGFFRCLWKLKNCGYFNHCSGIIFGRPLIMNEVFELQYPEMIKKALGDLNIPIIYDVDCGHVSPQIPLILGSIVEVESKDGKGKIKNILK